MAGYIGSQTPVVSNGSQRKYTFTATAAQTVFTGMDIPNPQQIQVFQNGVRLVITTDYTVSSGTTVTLVNAASAGDSLVVILFADYQLLDQDLSGDFSVDSPTFVVDSANNRIGVGTVSPSYLFHASGSGDAVAAVTAGATSIAALNLGNSTNLADGGIRYDNSADALIFRSANAERLRILSSGGITFNGDTAAANALNDYEEGTWTPVSQYGTVTYSAGSNTYTKIGDTVCLRVGNLNFSDITTAASITITGLPFAVASNAVGSLMTRYAGTTTPFVPYVSNSDLRFYQVSTTGTWYTKQHSEYTSASNSIYLTITYRTTS